MSKELKAIEILKKRQWVDIEHYTALCEFIEKELKDYEELEENLGFDPTIFKQDFETLMKEHKALEIIKKIVSIKDYSLGEYPPFVILSGGEIKTKEEYDLLKEVLL